MLLNKEYPATHSMSTAWYMVDDDDNVAILDMNENGPVPWGTPEESIESLTLGYDNEDEKKTRRKVFLVDLMPDQIKLLLSDPQKPEEYQWWFDCIVEVDADRIEEFLILASNKDCDEVYCISSELNLYHLSSDDAVVYEKEGGWHVRIRSSLKKMLDSHLILNVYDTKDFYINDRYNEETDSVEYEKEWDLCPYYIYAEPYWEEFLAKKLNTPDNPVKLHQMPEELRPRIIRIPGSFDNLEYIQIAKHVPCHISGGEGMIAYDCEYGRIPLEDGSSVYVLTDLLPESFTPYCPESKDHGCKSCGWNCTSCTETQLCAYPTVLIIDSPMETRNYEMKTSLDELFRYSLQVSLMPKFPSISNEGYALRDNEYRKRLRQNLTTYFQQGRGWLEKVIDKFKPHVILLKGGVEKILSTVYSIDDNVICIQGNNYPVFLYRDRKKFKAKILELAKQPYRGKHYPLIIPVEEMEKMIADSAAQKYSDYC